MSQKTKIAIAVSGKGRSLENFLAGDYLFEVVAVICSNPKAGAIAIAKRHKLEIYNYDFKHPDAEDLNAWLRVRGVEWVALAGFLKIFPKLPSYAKRVTNIHPALLPHHGGQGMYGMKVHEAVCSAGDKQTGATIHFVSEKYDEGRIIAQARIDLKEASSPSEIANQVFALECELYPATLAKLILHELPLNDGQIWQYRSEKC